MSRQEPRLGLIVNPIAGLGGAVALKGSDGAATQAAALARGAVPGAAQKADAAVRAIQERCPEVEILAFAGAMGHPAAVVIGKAASVPSSAVDTRRAAMAFRDRGVALLLFVGGDGTARDVANAVGESLPILGVPAGVKMQSAVFALSPRHAGELAAAFLAGDAFVRIEPREVMDIDEAALASGRLTARLHGFARVPVQDGLVQHAKAGQAGTDDVQLAATCRAIAREMAPGRLYVLGPGTTKMRILEALALEGTLLGVDAVRDGRLVGRDLDARRLCELASTQPTTIIVAVMGGHGCLFGRGNQQLAPEVIAQVGRDRILPVATLAKLAALGPAGLFVDTGDAAVDAMLAGFIKVRTGPETSVMMRVRA